MISASAIRAYSGVYLDLANPDPSLITLEDMAHHLARINRWTGAAGNVYTDAEHCVYVSCIAPDYAKRWAFLHDGCEYATGDCSKPMKRLLAGVSDLPPEVQNELQAELTHELWMLLQAALPGYNAIQRKWEHAVSVRFGVPIVDVKQWDIEALLAERRDLMGLDAPWIEDRAGYVAHPYKVYPLENPRAIERMYLRRAWELGIR